ncbi:hypothetical protein C4J81_09215 [Deltaproteobacteria bacterium Smac51]|nr:hypothetical protein C4J81_09215 [Deltaproteobacteria bacterium Smac51]
MCEKSSADIESRHILAPHPWPFRPAVIPSGSQGSLYYLSWPGWELYLHRRLGLQTQPDGPQPLLLPDWADTETDFKAIDQLNSMASQMGAGLLNLAGDSPESLPALLTSIRAYQGMEAGKPGGPALDDRSYLALWAISEYQTRQSEALLAEARASEKKMWAALKGEEEPHDPSETRLDHPASEPDRRTLYAWQVWRRLAGPLLRPADVIVPTAEE